MCQGAVRNRKSRFRFRHRLLSLDSTMIPFRQSMFEWAFYVRTKGEVKLPLSPHAAIRIGSTIKNTGTAFFASEHERRRCPQGEATLVKAVRAPCESAIP